tara:strand:- start:545 stop:751 length:207 start_codon:yes stop_codon:yes gene_type:complete
MRTVLPSQRHFTLAHLIQHPETLPFLAAAGADFWAFLTLKYCQNLFNVTRGNCTSLKVKDAFPSGIFT